MSTKHTKVIYVMAEKKHKKEAPKIDAKDMVSNLRKSLKNSLIYESIVQVEKFLLLVLDKISSMKLSENDKRNLNFAYHRLWWYRTNLISRYSKKEQKDFSKMKPFAFLKYKSSAEKDLENFLDNNPKYLNLVVLPKGSVFKKDILNTLNFLDSKSKELGGSDFVQPQTIFFLDTKSGKFWHTDPEEFCYQMEINGNRFKILEYLIENREAQRGKEIAWALGLKKPEDAMKAILNIRGEIYKHLKIPGNKVILSNNRGYMLSPDYVFSKI